MARIGDTYRCGAGTSCDKGREGIFPDDLDEQYDRYGIYAGMWHESCWERHGYGNFVFDAAYAGESLEGDDY